MKNLDQLQWIVIWIKPSKLSAMSPTSYAFVNYGKQKLNHKWGQAGVVYAIIMKTSREGLNSERGRCICFGN